MNLAHPGEALAELCLEWLGMSALAECLGEPWTRIEWLIQSVTELSIDAARCFPCQMSSGRTWFSTMAMRAVGSRPETAMV